MSAHEVGDIAARAATRAAVEALSSAESLRQSNEEETMEANAPPTPANDEAEVIELHWPDRVIERDIEGPLARRERARRVSEFFPRPELTDWSVRDLDYKRDQ